MKQLTNTYYDYLGIWKGKKTNFPLFYGLRDFYGLIKNFMAKVVEREIERDDSESLLEAANESIF